MTRWHPDDLGGQLLEQGRATGVWFACPPWRRRMIRLGGPWATHYGPNGKIAPHLCASAN